MDLIILTAGALFLMVQGVIAIAAVYIARNTGAIVQLLKARSPVQHGEHNDRILKLGQRPAVDPAATAPSPPMPPPSQAW